MPPVVDQDVPLLRTSERAMLKKCEFAHDLAYTRRLKSATGDPPALRFGGLVHRSLEAFYRPGLKRGPKPAVTFQKLYKKELKVAEADFGMRVEDEWTTGADLGVTMLENYYEHYGKDQRYQVIVTEQSFQVPVYRKVKIRGRTTKVLWFYYVGTLDGIWWDREKKKLLIVDHKTAKSIKQLIAVLPQDDQAGAYWTWGVDWIREKKLLKPDQKLNGLLYNILRKGKPDERPRNEEGLYLNNPTKNDLLVAYPKKLKKSMPLEQMVLIVGEEKAALAGQVSKNQPTEGLFDRHSEWRTEANRRRQREHVADEMSRLEDIRSGRRNVTKTPSMFHCPGCAYRDPCELHEAGADFEEIIKAGYKTWEPYDAHEVIMDRN